MAKQSVTVYEPGSVIADKYELEELLGQGGMGAVWRARNLALDAPVAIKLLRTAGDRASLGGRLLQEARAAAKLTHAAIVKVFDVGETGSGDPFIVMELLHGSSLGSLLSVDGRLSPVQAVRLLLPIADALSVAHRKGIIHRDLKPDNVFIAYDGSSVQPKLVDFGIVKLREGGSETHLTQAGVVLGSPDYMSPEQARGLDDIDLATDVWSFSVVLYEAIAGRPPFDGANYNALLRQIVEVSPPSLAELAAGDAELSGIVMRGLSKKPEDRFGSMNEMGQALAKWLRGQGVADDVCGASLEQRWLRETDPSLRAVGRGSLVSLNDIWPPEAGSGVHASGSGVANTIPAPPVEPSVAPSIPPRPRWRWLALFALLALLAGAWAALRLKSAPSSTAAEQALPASSAAVEPRSESAPPAQPSLSTAQPAGRVDLTPEVEASASASPQPPLETATQPPAQAAPRRVWSRKGRTPPARPPVRPTPSVGPAQPKAKGPDLLAPY